MAATMNLYQASNQWRTRPDDERFWTLDELLAATTRLREMSREADAVPISSLKIIPAGDGEQPLLIGGAGIEAKFTHYSFGQMSKVAGAPASYLRQLPPELVARNLNHGLERCAQADKDANRYLLLRQTNGHYHLSAALSARYDRIWDADVAERLVRLQDDGWRVPPARPSKPGVGRPATEEDCLKNRMAGIGIKPGDQIAPAGLYASDHDMFAFMVNEDGWLRSGGVDLAKGFFVSNSEVGDKAFTLTTFLYNSVCGNHIIWDVKDVKQLRIIHLGNGTTGNKAFSQMRVTLKRYADASMVEAAGQIEAARTMVIAANKDEVLDKLFHLKVANREDLEASLYLAKQHPEDSGEAHPHSTWAMAQGMTRLAGQQRHGEERSKLEQGAGKVVKMRF